MQLDQLRSARIDPFQAGQRRIQFERLRREQVHRVRNRLVERDPFVLATGLDATAGTGA